MCHTGLLCGPLPISQPVCWCSNIRGGPHFNGRLHLQIHLFPGMTELYHLVNNTIRDQIKEIFLSKKTCNVIIDTMICFRLHLTRSVSSMTWGEMFRSRWALMQWWESAPAQVNTPLRTPDFELLLDFSSSCHLPATYVYTLPFKRIYLIKIQ